MKTKTLKRIEISTAALLLALLVGCGKSGDTPVQVNAQEAAAPTAPVAAATVVAQAETPKPVAAAPAESAAPATPAGAIRYEAQPGGSKCTIAGTSSIHDWTMDSAIITGFIEADAKFPESALSDPAAAKPTVQVAMPVKAFKSGKTAMDQKMQASLSATNYPKFEYRLVELKPKSAAGAAGALQFEAIGTLTITGTTRTNQMLVTMEKKDGKLKVKSAEPVKIKFTDYKLKPPFISLPLLPDITVGDDLKITYEWSLAPKAAAAKP
jgi:hypothetical protein